VRLCDELDRRAEALHHAACAVSRAVIDDDEFKGAVRLRQDAPDGAPDRPLPVIDGEDHGDERVGREAPLMI
jgi:hypothetical protein